MRVAPGPTRHQLVPIGCSITAASWHPPCLGRALAAGDTEGRLLRGATSFEGPAVAPRELLASGGASSVAAGAGGWLPWGSISTE